MAGQGKADAGRIKSFLYAQRWGILSTHSTTQQGYPFGSVVPYDITSSGEFVIYISLIAEHYKNLSTAPAACLTIIDSFGIHDPQAHARASVLLTFQKVEDLESQGVRESYERRFPGSINYEIAHNFLFMKGTVDRVRWIGGFGDIQWLNPEPYRAAIADPLAYDSWAVIQHMNEDHGNALCDLVEAQTGQRPTEGSVQMAALYSDEFVIRHKNSGGDDVHIPFVRRIGEEAEVRKVMIETLETARTKLSQTRTK